METLARWLLGSVAASALGGAALAQVPGFHRTGYAPNTLGSRAYGLSADGRVAAGYSIGSVNSPGFTWTAGGGRVDFGLDVGMPIRTGTRAISGDGSTVVGESANRAFLYRGPGTYQEISPVGGYTATTATGVSGNGGVVAGRLFVPQTFTYQAFRWTSQGGVQPLGVARPGTDASSGAMAISRDGSTIVGSSGEGIAPSVAFAWRQGTGMVALSSLPGSTETTASGVSFDGSFIVGRSGALGSDPVMWHNGQILSLGAPSGWFGGEGFAVNDNGTVVVGRTNGGGSIQAATIWTPDFGMELLSIYLTRNGIAVPSDLTLLQATAVSADGLTIAGFCRNSQTGGEGFVVTIPAPCPADLDNDGDSSNGGMRDRAVTIDDLLYFLASFESGSQVADLDDGTGTGMQDSAVTIEDLVYFLAHFEEGC